MATNQATALSSLKAQVVPTVGNTTVGIDQILPQFIRDKGYSTGAIRNMSRSGHFGTTVSRLLLRSNLPDSRADTHGTVWNYFGNRIHTLTQEHAGFRPYKGDPVDSVIADRYTTMLSGPKTFIGQGATSAVSLVGVPLPNNYGEVPIAILGAGPAGIMAARSLRELGFRNIELIEKRDENGIWAQPNVYNGSRNNPRDVDFSGIQKLIAAPGNGYEVVNFLHRLLNVEVKKKSLSRVEPGNLRHKLFFDGLKTPKTFPIVINAMGLGKPNPISDGERMIGNPGRAVPKRWQQPRLELKDVEKKRFIFIGLGNSTAEMIRKLHDFEDQGYEVDYRILTHYPRDSVFAPSDTVIVREKGFRVFRDISKPQLVSFQGDLPSSRADYYRALMNGRIISDIRQWIVGGSGKEIAAFDDDGVSLLNISFDDLYVLTGYGHSPEAYASMGCTYDNDLSCALHDYDGEIIQRKGAAGGERVYKGYFGFGAVLDAPHNPNTVVIPGMAYRLPDLLFGVIMRAGEYVQAKK